MLKPVQFNAQIEPFSTEANATQAAYRIAAELTDDLREARAISTCRLAPALSSGHGGVALDGERVHGRKWG
jgi:hypothetical protein